MRAENKGLPENSVKTGSGDISSDLQWLREQVELHRRDSRFAYAYSDLCVRYIRIANALERASHTSVTEAMVSAAIATTGNLEYERDEVLRANVRRMLQAALDTPSPSHDRDGTLNAPQPTD